MPRFTKVNEIARDQWDAYIRVQSGGETNMWDCNRVSTLSGREISPDEAFTILKNYNQLTEWFGYSMHGLTGDPIRDEPYEVER